MPGKVNPTQAEALTMVSARVFGNQATIAFAGSQGHFELNVYMPVIAFAFLESLALLGAQRRGVRCAGLPGSHAGARRLNSILQPAEVNADEQEDTHQAPVGDKGPGRESLENPQQTPDRDKGR
jgi:fumarate hydratase class II